MAALYHSLSKIREREKKAKKVKDRARGDGRSISSLTHNFKRLRIRTIHREPARLSKAKKMTHEIAPPSL